MSFQELMLTYGYPVLFVGVLAEGEAFLIIGAYLAHRGYFSLPYVVGIAALSSFVSGQVYFFLGRRYGQAFLAKRPRWQERFERVQQLLNRYSAGLVVGYRALYGLRIIIPAGIALSDYPLFRFSVLNAVGALLWAVVIALAGNSIAQVAGLLFEDVRRHEWLILVVVACLAVGWHLFKLYRQPTLKKNSSLASEKTD